MVRNNVDVFQVLTRKQMYYFSKRIFENDNVLVQAVVNGVSFMFNKMNVTWMKKINNNTK